MRQLGWFMAAGLALAATRSPSALAQRTEPGIDCSKARSPLEKAICANPPLIALDRQVAIAYDEALARQPEQRDAIRQQQIAWLRQRDVACAVPAPDLPACLRTQLTARIAALAPSPAPPAPAAAAAAPKLDAAAARIPDPAIPSDPAAASRRHARPDQPAGGGTGRNPAARHGRRPFQADGDQPGRRRPATRRHADRAGRRRGRGRIAGWPARPDARCGRLQAPRIFGEGRQRQHRAAPRAVSCRGASRRPAAAGPAARVRACRWRAAGLLAVGAEFRHRPDRGSGPLPGGSAALAQWARAQRLGAGSDHDRAGAGPSTDRYPARRLRRARHLPRGRLWRPPRHLDRRRRIPTILSPLAALPMRSPAAGPAATIGPFGSEIYRLPAATALLRLQVPQPADASVAAGDASASIARDSREPVASLDVAPGTQDTVEVRAAAGQRFTLRALDATPAQSFDKPGNYWVSVTATGAGGDEVPPTVLLERETRSGQPARIIADTLPVLGPDKGWHTQFNLRGPTTLLARSEGGSVALRTSGVPVQGGRTDTDLPAGFYALALAPRSGALGALDVILGPPGLNPPLSAKLPADPVLPFGLQTLALGDRLRVRGGTAPGISFGLSARPAPVALVEGPLAVTLASLASADIPVVVSPGGALSVTEIGSGPVPYTTRQDSGRHRRHLAAGRSCANGRAGSAARRPSARADPAATAARRRSAAPGGHAVVLRSRHRPASLIRPERRPGRALPGRDAGPPAHRRIAVHAVHPPPRRSGRERHRPEHADADHAAGWALSRAALGQGLRRSCRPVGDARGVAAPGDAAARRQRPRHPARRRRRRRPAAGGRRGNAEAGGGQPGRPVHRPSRRQRRAGR